ncbi:MAG: monovalent cation/H(+) antiporter subunit G [Anaerolineales bacterium]|mgnify:CR=1 FL=1|jgi:multicomponent Na+:H+ antiporter subunit G|nr:monovalent cation/H(+) antiporter subunit G [Anaerolineales bacterium]
MYSVSQIIGLLCLVLGTVFSMLGILGLLRLPDVYARLHATGKVSGLGAVFLLAAAIFLTPLSAGKGLVLIGLLLLTTPAVSHAIASAAYRIGIPIKAGQRDELRKRLPKIKPHE